MNPTTSLDRRFFLRVNMPMFGLIALLLVFGLGYAGGRLAVQGAIDELRLSLQDNIAEYMEQVKAVNAKAADVYRYMNFDQIEEFKEVADTVEV